MIYAIDIDGTICSDEKGEYDCCKPDCGRIESLQRLYEGGHMIVIHTARTETRRLLTMQQLDKWGVPYHELVMGKPKADFYVDDKSAKPEEVL